MDATPFFVKIADLRKARGLGPLHETPGLWCVQVDDEWWFAINGHDEPLTLPDSDVAIPFGTMMVKLNGWPAGELTPSGGIFAAGREDDFLTALDGATDKAA